MDILRSRRCKYQCNFLQCTLLFTAGLPCQQCNATPSFASNTKYDRSQFAKHASVDGQDFIFRLNHGGHRKSAKKRRSRISLLDSGADVHICNDLSYFNLIHTWDPGHKVKVGDGALVPVVGIGTVTLRLQNQSGEYEKFVLQNVYYMPKISQNILSVGRLWKDHGLKSRFEGKSHLKSKAGSKFYLHDAPMHSNGPTSKYYVESCHSITSPMVFTAQPSLKQPDCWKIWHRRFMHQSEDKIRAMCKHIPELAKYAYDSTLCDACCAGGARRKSFTRHVNRYRQSTPKGHDSKRVYTYFGERISSDVCGPFKDKRGKDIRSANGNYMYAVVFIDSYSRWIAVYGLVDHTKESLLAAFQKFMLDYKDQLTRGIGEFHTDNGGDYSSKIMHDFCNEMAIRQSFTVPYSPPHNPHAERSWGILLRKVRICLHQANLHHAFWFYAMQHAAFIHNICIATHGYTPWELIYGKLFDYSTLKAFACKCWDLLREEDRDSKVSPVAVPAVYLGPDAIRRGGHQLYIPRKQLFTTSFHVLFSEGENLTVDEIEGEEPPQIPYRRVTFGNQRRTLRYSNESRDVDDTPIYDGSANDGPTAINSDPTENSGSTENSGDAENSGPISSRTRSSGFVPISRNVGVNQCSVCQRAECKSVNYVPKCERGGCVFIRGHDGGCSDEPSTDSIPEDPIKYVHVVSDTITFQVLATDLSDTARCVCPETYAQATSGVQKDEWHKSMQKEHTDLLKHGTWDVVSRKECLDAGRKPLKSRWVYTIKYNRDGTIERFKSRFVVCGYSQVQGRDFEHAFSATLRSTSFRCLLAVASGKKLKLEHFDVTNAFTQAPIDDVDLWVEPPKGWDKERDKYGTKVLRLKKALYGTRQASRLWQETLTKFLVELGFHRSEHDPCIFYYKSEKHGELILGIYVDDIILAHDHKGFDWFCSKFCQSDSNPSGKFRAKHIGPLHWFLGMAVDQSDDGSVSINQERYIRNMVAKYLPGGLRRPVLHPNGPAFAKLRMANSDAERSIASKLPYQNLVGALLFAAVMCRPDISYHTSMLAKFMSDPTEACYDLAISVLLYLSNEPSLSLSFDGSTSAPDMRGKTGKNPMAKVGKNVVSNSGFIAYSDSSWGPGVAYPMYGYCVYLFGGLVSFASKQLKVVAFSSCEAEYAAASHTAREMTFIRNICRDMGLILHGALIIVVDNSAAIDVAQNTGVSAKTKHFDQCVHHLRREFNRNRALPVHCLTIYQRADGFTKGLDRAKHLCWVKGLFDLKVKTLQP